ncbi:uncharacterized protein LOC132728918, partial [Ruditapes philippinarum]|uniref:uncharacterized protein LOC132728918 n=1 Tax=Ruditapes philippinarum TaxID=129788 RepID=UPI00295A74E0
MFRSLLSPFWEEKCVTTEQQTQSLKRQHSFCENASRKKQERLIRRLSGTLLATRLEGNRMSIPHRILTTDGTQKQYPKSLTESDSSGDYVTPGSSMADVSCDF